MAEETTIPVLHCISLSETMDFYRTLGFEVTHKQSAPYVYLAMHRGGIDLHFYGREGVKREDGFGICLWMVQELEPLHRTFAEALRQKYGKLPVAGIPRIARMRRGQRRFTMVDPSGNSVIVIERETSDRRAKKKKESLAQEPPSRLARAIRSAEHTRVFQNDDALAAEVLDAALARDEPCPPIDRARALAARAELAVALGDAERVQTLRAELAQIVLSDAERASFREELEAAEELERTQS